MRDRCVQGELFLNPGDQSRRAYLRTIGVAAEYVASVWSGLTKPVEPMDYDRLMDSLDKLKICPELGIGTEAALREVKEKVLPYIVAVTDPGYVAHYHSPPILPSLAAEVMISATNQSLDSFDQSPSATALEIHVVRWLCQLVGFGSRGSGVFTSGGTQSNLMGLLLARDSYASRELACDIAQNGLPAGATQWSILTSELAHFSVAKSLHLLGLGAKSVVLIPGSSEGALCAHDVKVAMTAELNRRRIPIALVLTAGTTETGTVDRLEECTLAAKDSGLWVHVDAAAGGALLLSEQHHGLLRGVELADSVSIDFHKLFFQAISCGALAVRDESALNLLRRDIQYLDPEDAPADAAPNLVGKTIQTTRRFDALKVFVSFRALGRKTFADLIDHCLYMASEAAVLIKSIPTLTLLETPVTNTVVFRWTPPTDADPKHVIQVNQQLPGILWKHGAGVLGRCCHRGVPALKMSFLNPLITTDSVRSLLQAVEQHGGALWNELSAARKGPAYVGN